MFPMLSQPPGVHVIVKQAQSPVIEENGGSEKTSEYPFNTDINFNKNVDKVNCVKLGNLSDKTRNEHTKFTHKKILQKSRFIFAKTKTHCVSLHDLALFIKSNQNDRNNN